MAICGGLEQTVVQDVPKGFSQGAQDLLLGLPHCGVWVEPQTFLQERQEKTSLSFNFTEQRSLS